MKKFVFCVAAFLIFSIFNSCKKNSVQNDENLFLLLEAEDLSAEREFALTNKIAQNFISQKCFDDAVLFLTGRISRNQENPYNAYWLLMCAYIYLDQGVDSFAEYYFERILRDYDDLLVQNESVHFLCLKNLIPIAKKSEAKIDYLNQMLAQFPEKTSATEIYVRLAKEYEKLGDWNQVMKAYSLFLEQDDASTTQIIGIPDAFSTARQTINFAKSKRDWTFESLSALKKAVQTAIATYDWRALDKYRTKVNFFAMSWGSDESATHTLELFSMRDYMRGQKIRCASELDETSNQNEAYLRTWGWSQYINVWYLYFRKVNFPADPEIHGRWEWAGIYFGEKL